MNKLIFLMAFWLMLPLAVKAEHPMRGRVVDAADNNTLAGAHVVLKGTYHGVFTNREGEFVLGELEQGEHVVRVSFMGYETIEKSVDHRGDTFLELKLERKATMTDEVVVSALRADGQAPVTFTNLDREDLEARNLGQDLPFLLNQTPSLTTSSDAGAGVGYTWMNIRGSDQSRINVTINGIPVNDAESHGVWWVNMPDIASSIDNLQVQRGVGLSTHGAGAFGATINMHSASLRNETYAEVNSAVGSFNTLKNTVRFGTGLMDEKWSFDGRLSKISSDGYIDRASADLKSFHLSGGYYGKNTMVKAVAFSGKETTYQAWYGVPSDSLTSNRTFNPSGMYYDDQGGIRFYDNETDNYQQDHYQLHLSHTFSSGLTASGALHYTYGRGYYEQYRPDENLNSYNLPDITIGDEVIERSDLVRRRWLDNHFYGLTYSLNYNNYHGLEVTFGGGYNEYDGDHYGEIIWARYAEHTDIRHRYYDNNGFKKDFNSFLKTNYALMPGLNLLADMQYRYVSYSFLGQAWVHNEVVPLQQKEVFHFFNPKTGVSYDINSLNTLYIFAGIGNREPVRRDFTESSPESRPSHETLRNIELGYEYESRQAGLGVNFYLMDYKDQLILTGEINDVGGYTRTNIDESYRAGVELQGRYLFNEYVQWSGNLTISRNKIPSFEEHVDRYDDDWNWIGTDVRTYEDTDIAFSPSVIAASHLRVSPLNNLDVSLESKYVGDQYIDNTMSEARMLDAFLVNDLRVYAAWETSYLNEIELVFSVINVFDVDYETNAWVYKGVVGDQGLMAIEDGYFPQAGRQFMAGVNVRF